MPPPAAQNQPMTFWAGVLTASLCIMFGANAVAIKISLTGLGVLTNAALRFTMAAVVIAIWAGVKGKSFRISRNRILPLVIIGLNFTVQLSLFYLGLSKTYASRGAVLINLLPFMVLFLAHFFIPGDRITARKLFGIFLGFAGVIFVFMERTGITSEFYAGDIIMLVATFIWACNMVYIKRVNQYYEPFHIVFYQIVISVPFFYLGGWLWDGTMLVDLNVKVLGALAYQGLIATAFGFVVWNTLLKRFAAVGMHTFVFIMPISGVCLSGIVLGEIITVRIWLALFLVSVGILVVNVSPRKFLLAILPGRGI